MTENISTIVVAFSAFVTAGATIVLAFITGRYVHITNEILKATNMPKVILFLRHSRYSISLCVQNIGTVYCHRRFRPLPKGRLCYNSNLN